MDGEKTLKPAFSVPAYGGMRVMRRFHWREAVALNPPTGCHGRMVAVGKVHRISCGALSSPALRIHTLAPVSFPLSPSTFTGNDNRTAELNLAIFE